MNPVKFENVYYIKLGRGGEWEESSIEENKARIGWGGQTIEDINHRNWEQIGRQLRKYFEGKGVTNRGASTRDLNMLKMFAESTSHDVWITFHNSCLWWCRLKESGVQSDEISKYREVKERWSDQDIDGNRLIVNQIPGRLSKIQAFRGTVCKVRRIEDLSRLLNHELSEESRRIGDARENLVKEVEVGLKRLHWRDFETLVDLLFTGAGWHRLSSVGKAMKFVDMEFEEPITKDIYQVQVKSAATSADLEQYSRKFSSRGFKRLYFVVHTPSRDLLNSIPDGDKRVELVLPNGLAKMVVELGLTGWLLKKIA